MASVRALVIKAASDVIDKGAKPKDAIDAVSLKLDRRDRAFLMELLYGVIRHYYTLDFIIGKFAKNPSGLKPATMNNLRAGLYQIMHMRVPDWAAVNESVDAERHQKKLVNAVLRGFIRERPSIEAALNGMRDNINKGRVGIDVAVESMSILTSHPEWLIRRWINRFGMAPALNLCDADNMPPPITLRANILKTSRDNLMLKLNDMGIGCGPTSISPVGVRLTSRHSHDDLLPLKGLFTIQDEAAQIVTLMLDPKPGSRALDAAAAPGGKSTHMAELMNDSGEIIAVDVDERRMERLRENVKSLDLKSIKPVIGDILTAGGLGEFDAILVDAPCSSIGVIRRNPDVKYRHAESDMAAFGIKQLRMLEAASKLLKKNSRLVYSTCSTEPDEGEDVVNAFLKQSGDCYMIDESPVAGDMMRSGMIRTYPHRHGTDGFFAARIKRKCK